MKTILIAVLLMSGVALAEGNRERAAYCLEKMNPQVNQCITRCVDRSQAPTTEDGVQTIMNTCHDACWEKQKPKAKRCMAGEG